MDDSSDILSTKTLYDLIYACQRSQRVAIVGSHTDENPLREQLYVEQQEDEVVAKFFDENYTEDGRLLILTGSAGDGKSALLARGYERANNDFPSERVNMDATEARRRDGDYADRLTDFLQNVMEDIENESGPRSAVAINYGLAVDYFERRNNASNFGPIWDAMQQSQHEPTYQPSDENIIVINLSHRRTYKTHPKQLGEGLVRELLDRFDPTHEESPFAEAYEREQEDCPAGDDCILQYNIRQLTHTTVKDRLARLFAGWSLVTGSYLNPRTILDSIASMLLPAEQQEFPEHDVCPVGAAIDTGDYTPTETDLVWNGIFRTLDSEENFTTSLIDPTSRTSFEVDQKALEWASEETILEERLPGSPDIDIASQVGPVRTFLRYEYLKDSGGKTILDDDVFHDFLSALTFFRQSNPPDDLRSGAQEVLKNTQTALSSWTGRERDDNLVEFVDGWRSAEYRYLSEWNQPQFDQEESKQETQSLAVPGRLRLMAEAPEGQGEYVPIPLSFETYHLITQISQGYTPNATDLDQSHAIRMLHSRLDSFTNKREKVIIEDRSESKRTTITDEELQINISSEEIR